MPVVSSVWCGQEVPHLFERDSTQQQSVSSGCLLLQHRRDFGEFAGVISRTEPSARRVDDTVESDVLRDDEFAHALHDHSGAPGCNHARSGSACAKARLTSERLDQVGQGNCHRRRFV